LDFELIGVGSKRKPMKIEYPGTPYQLRQNSPEDYEILIFDDKPGRRWYRFRLTVKH
jgi:hypothetical protein